MPDILEQLHTIFILIIFKDIVMTCTHHKNQITSGSLETSLLAIRLLGNHCTSQPSSRPPQQLPSLPKPFLATRLKANLSLLLTNLICNNTPQQLYSLATAFLSNNSPEQPNTLATRPRISLNLFQNLLPQHPAFLATNILINQFLQQPAANSSSLAPHLFRNHIPQ